MTASGGDAVAVTVGAADEATGDDAADVESVTAGEDAGLQAATTTAAIIAWPGRTVHGP